MKQFKNTFNLLYMKSINDIIKDEKQISINETQQAYSEIIEKLQEAKDNNLPIDEGIFSAVAGLVAGATIGPSIMKGVCKCLGISESGPMGNLMTSRLVLSSLGAYLGYKA